MVLQVGTGVLGAAGDVTVFDMRSPAAPVQLTYVSFAAFLNTTPLAAGFGGRLVSVPELNGGQVSLYQLGACGDQ